MKKIAFTDVAPHLIAVLVFLTVTVLFFRPVVFEGKSINQHDIQQFQGSAKALVDYRNATGEEALWANSMFSGMPAYLINVDWSEGAIGWFKRIGGFFLPGPLSNIYWAFLSYYILLLAFRVRPYLAIAGALAFGLSSFVIVGLAAGHNGRIGAMAFMPLVLAGIHLAFTNKKTLGLGITALGLALHLRENHLQVTYYLMLIVAGYGLMQVIVAFRQRSLGAFGKTIGLLVPAALLAAGSFFGPFWAISEYSDHTIRGKRYLTNATTTSAAGLTKDYVFDYSNGIAEPLTLIIPNIMGGSTSHYIVQNQESETFKVLSQNARSQEEANQLAQYSAGYFGEQGLTAPYYAGAIIVFLFFVGAFFAESKYVWWATPLIILAIAMSWGKNFGSLNYFLFDFLPGYNKFRSVTFTTTITLVLLPLIGMLGLEKLMATEFTKQIRNKLWLALAIPGGLCLLVWLVGGFGTLTRPFESDLPAWFLNALKSDRQELVRGDAFRSLLFILPVFLAIYFQAWKRVSMVGFQVALALLVWLDIAVVDWRYFTKDNFIRKVEMRPELHASNQEILKDKGHYRVFNITGGAFNEANTSYFHNSIGGYHGAKMRRYQDVYDTLMVPQLKQFISGFQAGNRNFESMGAANMLNARYLWYGPNPSDFLFNPAALGNAWFVSDVKKVSTDTEEMALLKTINPGTTAITADGNFKGSINTDSTATVQLTTQKPAQLQYQTSSQSGGLAVFSEIYYPHGWSATIDGQEAPILRVNYLLRGLEIPAGQHKVEFTFAPKAYVIGDKVTMASCWMVLLVLGGSLFLELRKEKPKA